MQFTIDGLQTAGFTGFVPFNDLDMCQSPQLDEPGVYMVLRPAGVKLTLSEVSTGFWYQGEDPAYTLADLESQCNLPTPVLYIGKAGGVAGGTTVRERLNLYRQYGKGENTSHRGGKAIWQIEDAARILLLCWLETPGLAPECVESQYLEDFKGTGLKGFGSYPMANRQGGRKKCPHTPPCETNSSLTGLSTHLK